MECMSPNIHVPDLSAGPAARKKRFQVHAACTQCKKSHAACSMTRPCERCVRVGEAHLCVDMPRKRRGKHANQLLNAAPQLDAPPAPPTFPDDVFTPIDEISDFLFDGLENHLLADSTLRNVTRMEGSALNAKALLHTRPLFGDPTYHQHIGSLGVPACSSSPLFGGPTSQYTRPINASSPSSSGTPSPVPTSPYSPNSGNLSPLSFNPLTTNYPNFPNYTSETTTTTTTTTTSNYNATSNINHHYPDDSTTLSPDAQTNKASNNLHATNNLSPNINNISPHNIDNLSPHHVNNLSPHIVNNLSPHHDLYATTHEYRPTDEALINAHINNLLNSSGVLYASTLSSSSSTPSTPSIWTDPSFVATLAQHDEPQEEQREAQKESEEEHTPEPQQKEAEATPQESPLDDGSRSLVATPGPKFECAVASPFECATPDASRDLVARLMGMDASNAKSECLDEAGCSLPQCFCNKVKHSGKVQIVCTSDTNVPEGAVVPPIVNKPDAPNAIHSVVEALVREVQSLRKEMRGDAKSDAPKIGQPSYSTGPAVAVWDMVEQRLLECNETFASLFCVDPSEPLYLTDIAQCPAYFLRLCAANKTSWHEKRRYSLKRPEGDINLVVAIDINGTCVVTTVWKAE